jgi:inner membrane protein
MHRLSLLLKAIVIFIMTLAILIPLEMIRSTIADRQSFRQQAVASIAESYAGAQTVVGPLVIVPYSVDVPVVTNDVNGVAHTQIHSEQRHWMFFPKDLHLDGQVKTNVRHRGLHEVRVYELDSKLAAHFDFTPPTQVAGGTLREIGTPFLSIGVDDVRGLIGSPRLKLDGRPATLLQGPGTDRAGAGVHAELPALVAGKPRALDVALDFVLGGTEQLAIAPIADNNRIELISAWQHPEFAGRFLPHTRNISTEGFDAVWEISALAANTQSQYLDGGDAQGCGPAPTATALGTGCPGSGSSAGAKEGADRIELTLVDPVNIYTQADRASKYGLLFVLLTFVGFFMFETIKQLRIHPIQYLLAGLGLAIFFLLLLSLSEHIPFVWAYIIASAACIGLLGFYLAYVLHSRMRGIGFATMLTALYAVLYGLLISEDNALVLGSIMLFAILAAIMVITRKIDWYRVGQAPEAVAATQP